MTRPARFTIVQFRFDAPQGAEENLALMQEYVRRYRTSDLIVFPELALHGHALTHDHESQARAALAAVTEDQIRAFEESVRSEKARVVYGKLVERDGQLFNLATFTDGARRESYAKTHVHWSEAFAPGTGFPVVDTDLGPIGMLICFDAAFPEVPRILATKGARIIVNVSAIPGHFPLKHVHRRLVAASIQNQVFTVFANRTGEGFRGGSAVVNPRGDVVAVANEEDDVLTVDVDLSEIDAWRQEEPLFPHRRPDLYGELVKE